MDIRNKLIKDFLEHENQNGRRVIVITHLPNGQIIHQTNFHPKVDTPEWNKKGANVYMAKLLENLMIGLINLIQTEQDGLEVENIALLEKKPKPDTV